MDLETLRKKVKGISTNIAIYSDHLKKYKKELSNKYNLDGNNVNVRLDKIEGSVRRLKRKKQKLYSEAKEILKGIKDNVD